MYVLSVELQCCAEKLIVGVIPLLSIEPRRIRWDERQFLELNLVHEDPTLMLDV